MIINDILFIHATKCGGTSMQHLLHKNNNSTKIQSNIFCKAADFFKKTTMRRKILYKLYKLTKILPLQKMYNQHWTLQQYSEILNISKYNIIFICRNPIDRLISSYFFLEIDKKKSFYNFVLELITVKKKYKNSWMYSFAQTQKSYITINGIVPNNINIVHIENKKEINSVINKKFNLGLLPKKNVSKCKKKINMNKKIISLIKKEYAEDFEYFSYK